MANLIVKDGNGATQELANDSGDGSTGSPMVSKVADTTLRAQIGEVQASPTQYTLLDRLKALLTGISLTTSSAVIGHVVVDSGAVTSTLSATDEGLIGSLTETAPATDTASSGLNGRLQRLAQRITSLIALLPAALGAGGGLKVDGSGTALPISVATIPSHAVTNAGTFATQATLQAGTNNIGVVDTPITTPTVYNVTLTNADTEYSQALPANCRFFEFQCRTSYDVRFAFVTGKVATPTAPYMTLKSTGYYFSPQINQGGSPSTLYLASSQAGVVVGIIGWA